MDLAIPLDLVIPVIPTSSWLGVYQPGPGSKPDHGNILMTKMASLIRLSPVSPLIRAVGTSWRCDG